MALMKTRDITIYKLDRLLEPPSVSIFYEGVEYNEVDQLVRDLLLVPATGAGVERLFNSVRDIYYYCRGSLHEGTIQDLMIGTAINSSGETIGERELREDEALKAIEEDIEPISDNKEIEESENLEVECTVVETGRSSIYRYIHEPKQEEESVEEDVVDYDEVDLLPPPIMSQKRSSGRVTMPSSRLRGYEVY
ncbi:hypothetical protein N7501_002320 [Penicillium viridicatum]|nr:hypothetical protein N7501_002320 [Penicillium viridicatum]